MDESTEKPRGWLGGRGIDLAELDTSVRRVIFATYAVLLGLALATALHSFFEANGTYLVTPGIAVPKAVVWVAAPGAALAVILLFAGAAHARTRWKFFLIAPILLAVAVPLAASPYMVHPPLPLFVKVLFLTPLAFFAACIAVVAVGPRLRTLHVLVLIALLIATYAATLLLLSAAFWPVAPSAVFWVLAIGGICLFPALVVVGWDLAEICAEGAGAAMARNDRRTPSMQRLVRIGLIVGVFAAALALHFANGQEMPEGRFLIGIWVSLLLAAAAAGIWMASRRPKQGASGHLGYRQVMLLAIPLSILGLIGSATKEPDPRYFIYDKTHSFSIILPKGMVENLNARVPEKGEENKITDTRLMFRPGKKLPNMTVAAIVRPRFRHADEPIASLNLMVDALRVSPIAVQFSAPNNLGWRFGIAEAHVLESGTPLSFVVYKREMVTATADTEADWYVICGTRTTELTETRAMCERARRSLRFQVMEQPSPKITMAIDLALFVATIAAFVLVAVRSRRKQEPLLDLAAWVLLLTTLNGIGAYALNADETLFNISFTTDLLTAMLIAAGIGGLVIEAWPKPVAAGFQTVRTRAVAARLNATLLILAGVVYLYVFAAAQAEESQAVRGLVVCLALTWELATAGATVNQHGSGYVFPRTSRILVFAGYLILMASVVFLFAKKLDATFLGADMDVFDTEVIVAAGLVLVGGAFAIIQALRCLPGLHDSSAFTIPDEG